MPKFRDKLKVAFSALSNKNYKTGNENISNWNWKGGYLWNGSKFDGSKLYPSGFTTDIEKLRDASRAAYWDSMQARGIVGRFNDTVICDGLHLEYRPFWKFLEGNAGLNDKEKQNEIISEVESRFYLWMNSKEVDASERMNGFELQGYQYLNQCRDGETFVIFRYSSNEKRMSPLSLQYILPEQVSTPGSRSVIDLAKINGNRIEDGIEIDKNGKAVAIYVTDAFYTEHQRIPFFGKDRRFILHPMVYDIIGSVRGNPILSPVIHELKKITDYEVAEIQAAVGNAIFAAFIKPSAEKDASKLLKAGAINKNGTDTASESTTDRDYGKFNTPGLFVQGLKAGETLESFDTKRPNTNFGGFLKDVTKHISASLGLPIEILEESFNANYSASRASLLLFWNRVNKERASFQSQFLIPIFEAWIKEEIKAKRINLPGFGKSPAIDAAWLSCSFVGRNLPSIDPQKEATAVDTRIAAGLTTREREAQNYNGSDFEDNVAKLKIENQKLQEANTNINNANGGF